ncbi:MAG: hypothetical protein ACI4OP_03395 [Candidatus Coprovivens sp.]
MEVFTYTGPPAPYPAIARSFTGIRATPCSNTQSRLDSKDINLTISPYSLV